jgi:hypothetical protein
MDTTRRAGLNSTALALIPLAIAINIAGGQLVKATRLPIYLDSIGTVITGALLGPWIGLLTGLLSNTIWTLIGLDQYALSFAPVAGIIGLLAGFVGRAGLFQRESPRWLSAIFGAAFLFALTLFVMMFIYKDPDPNAFPPFPSAADLVAQQPLIFLLAVIAGGVGGYAVLQRAGYAGISGLLVGFVAALVSAPIATYLFGGVTGAGTDVLFAAFYSATQNVLTSALAQGSVSDPFDKMTSFIIVWLIMQALPRRLLRRFPNTRAVPEDTRPIAATVR